MIRVMVSLTGVVRLDADGWSVAILLGQPLMKLNRPISTFVESYRTIEPFLRLFARSDGQDALVADVVEPLPDRVGRRVRRRHPGERQVGRLVGRCRGS